MFERMKIHTNNKLTGKNTISRGEPGERWQGIWNPNRSAPAGTSDIENHFEGVASVQAV